ncbi:NDP-hexose 2,3-dehydratase family protein [Streptomyces rimosus]|uniref:NDP-hexose 2,3-dehydratase family protein n=1 Tax=Streptomyces rimosus TaxID=1927 RepID=UPI000517E169|nr:NDP-hexose 2,3-dehydratase family protein [Streptomyces rimosus]
MPAERLRGWLHERLAANRFQVDRIPFHEMREWDFDPGTGNLRHASGRFFSVEGLRVRTDYGPVSEWTQPVINQPEIGILGILVKRIDGVLHCLMSAKMEPGNVNLLQLSPTVQATRSNYTRVHRGAATPYLQYFLPGRRRGRILVDVLQSEQGSWFYRKCNRNMVVEVDADEDVDAGSDYCWLTIGQVLGLMRHDNLVNMDTRTVLACMPFTPPATAAPDGAFRTALLRSLSGEGAELGLREVLSWVTEGRTRYRLSAELLPLHALDRWHRTESAISHEQCRFFDVMAVSVNASNREVAGWTQPLIEPRGNGEVAMLVKRIGGTLHALMHLRMEPGFQSGVELAPTVQCQPLSHAGRPAGQQPPLLDLVRSAAPESVRYDAVLSEEGGRFHHARSRYRIIEVDERTPIPESADFRWLTVHQLSTLLQHSTYLNVQARSLVTSLHSLWAGAR